MKVIDLLPDIGGRSIGFKNAGFQVVYAIDNNERDANIYRKFIGINKLYLDNLNEINPETLPDADVITGKLVIDSFSVSGRKEPILLETSNDAIYNIIANKSPKFFLLEAPVSFLIHNKKLVEDILRDLLNLGYYVFYNVFLECEYSGYPVGGRQLFFVGIRKDIFYEEYSFPKPVFFPASREYPKENDRNINSWYRRIKGIEDINCQKGKIYLKNHNGIKEVRNVTMGYFNENYMVDSIGPRKFTHNELAWLKGYENYDFNNCSNKASMYRKIAAASNVFIVEAIAKSLYEYAYGKLEEQVNNLRINVIEKTIQKQVIFPKHIITNIHINELKGLKNADIPIGRNLTAIMGVNGSGKSTILHALACVNSPYEKGENYKFSFFFTPNPDANWSNSSFQLTYFDDNEKKEIPRLYKKNKDRWAPRYSNRPLRDVYFIGIETCIPEIEKEKQTSFIDYSTNPLSDSATSKIKEDAAYILNKNYDELTMHRTKKKELLGVHTENDLRYSSLSMGAGEQRVLKILRLIHSVNSYSLILIDEIDLLLHVTALKRLIEILYKIAEKKKLQIIFTTHSLEVAKLKEYVEVRYIEQLEQKTVVYASISADMIYEMSHEKNKPLDIYVEDLLSKVIVKQIAEDLNILGSVNIRIFGAASNAFTLAASYILKDEEYSNAVIVLDGDEYREQEPKIKAINKVLSGTEKEHEEKVNEALSMIKQFSLPKDMPPEKYIYDMLIEMDAQKQVVKFAKKINAVKDSHQWLDELAVRMGESEELVLKGIMELVSQHSKWADYTKDVHDWMFKKRAELNLGMEDT